MNWGHIREKGKKRFILLSGLVLSMPLALDYYIIRFLISSFKMDFSVNEMLIVWIICLLLGLTWSFYIWGRMERDWLRDHSVFK
ncbi:hypothetical protein [Bacillus massilinigeriensis]|uniref:hypothetical protein n=1 Tax=Bacillus massilionigeriensis TaxID=1805475 RepID=UPI00096AEE55|nr:hypothetical protein [Bacillus massilionigeriensis]